MAFGRRLSPIPLSRIRMTDRFWTGWQKVVREVTLKHEYDEIVKTGRLDNFRKAAGKMEGTYEGPCYNDSDVYKWLEAAGYTLVHGPQPELQKLIDEAIEAIAEAQEPGGYIDTVFQIKYPDLKYRNLTTQHEMYCGGHMIEAAVAIFESTGGKDRRLLDVAIKYADHLLSIFGPEKRRGYCGHEEIELALNRLASATGNEAYRELSNYFVEERGKRPTVFQAELDDEEAMKLSPWARQMFSKNGEYSGEYAQDHAPIRDHTEIVGHAVRAMYLYIAATEHAEDDALQEALVRIWNNLTRRRMYVTGGIGPSDHNEGFTGDYDLPNLTAYAETCAAVGLVFWGQKLLNRTGNSEYADILERALFNGAISGISLGGDRFFYTNPLESRGGHQRVEWFTTACCPPNIARLIGSVGAYVASTSDDAFWLHIPAGFEADVTIKGVPVKVTVESNYPWSGAFKVKVDPERPIDFELRVRIPEWSDEVETDLPGLDKESEYDAGYAVFSKTWAKGDVLSVDLNMESRWVEAHPLVKDDLGRAALSRGPLVYCGEAQDLGFAPQLFSADVEADVTAKESADLGGVTKLVVQGHREREDFVEDLYAPVGTSGGDPAEASLIPYYAWCNRGPNDMQVWFRRI